MKSIGLSKLQALFARSSLLVFALATLMSLPAQAQTYTVVHNFVSGKDGWDPNGDMIHDSAGNLYGTTNNGGVPPRAERYSRSIRLAQKPCFTPSPARLTAVSLPRPCSATPQAISMAQRLWAATRSARVERYSN